MKVDLDDALRRDFLVEAGEMLERLGAELVGLESTPDDSTLLNAVFRKFHTLKGSAGFLALGPMVLLCHRAEDLLNAARNGSMLLAAAHIDVLLEALDELTAMLRALGAATPLAPPSSALLQHLLPPAPKPPAPLPDRTGVTIAVADGAANDDAPISDVEFEALLDSLYGAGAPGVHEPRGAARAPVDAGVAEATHDAAQVRPEPSPVAASTPAQAASARAGVAQHADAEASVRVHTARLDALVDRAGELALVRNRLLTLAARDGGAELLQAVEALDRVADDLQHAVLGMRMQPIGQLFQRFPRIVRDLARQLGKDVELVLAGADTELDRSLVEALADPLAHLLRNALDHGVGVPEERVRAGKPRKGRVCLSACQRGGHIAIAVSDDGHGMDPEVLRRKAVEQGFVDAIRAAHLTEEECFELIFRPGFSTAAVSNISGRGVGLDVVRTCAVELGGTLRVSSRLGHGTQLELSVPLTVAILRVLMVRAGAQLLALPVANIDEVFELVVSQDPGHERRQGHRHHGRTLPLANLSAWAGVDSAMGQHVVVVVHIGAQQLGCVVDEVLAREDVVVKPLGPLFAGVPGIAGVTVAGDGRRALLVDLAGLADRDGKLRSALQMSG